MSILKPDLLTPLFDGNRNEILLIEYDGFIKNITEGIVLAMLTTREKWKYKYPGICDYPSLVNGDVYDASSLYNPHDFLKKLSQGNLSDEEINNDILSLEQVNVIPFQQTTMFGLALNNIISGDFIKRCYFIKVTEFYPHELNHIASTFNASINKIHIISGDIQEAFTEYLPTTCFINNLEDINKIIQMNKDTITEPPLFILRNTYKTVYYSPESQLFPYYPKVIEMINAVNKTKKYYIAPMYAFRQEIIPMDEPVG